MASFRIRPNEVAGVLKHTDINTRTAVLQGCWLSAVRARTLLVRKSKVIAHDRGVYANAWTVVPAVFGGMKAKRWGSQRGVVQVQNRTPYAGIIELGARPHPVSLDGQRYIREWVRRNIKDIVWSAPGRSGGSIATDVKDKKEKEIDQITKAIVWKLQREGQEGKYVVSKEIVKIERFTAAMVNDRIIRLAQRKASGGSR